MMKKLFVSVESALYITFIILDILEKNSMYFKYLGVVLCFVYAVYNKKQFISVALFFTCIADLFLLVLDKDYELGVLVFIFAQITYLYYLGNINSIDFTRFLGLRVIIFVTGLIILYLTKNVSTLNFLVVFYFTNLLVNCLNAFKTDRKLLAYGLALFVCCDICVGLYNINAANQTAAFLMWIFYLPSQVLISLS